MADLTSKWSGLSRHLLASIYPVQNNGQPIAGGPVVVAPLTEATVEITANWQSPFEQSGAETKAPAIAGMLQTGALLSYVEAIFGKGSQDGLAAQIVQRVQEFTDSAAGRSGMTKLNSTQVFTGAAPIKFSLTLLFRAFDNPTEEVRSPVDQLAQWVLAQQLAANGSIAQGITNLRDGQGPLKALLPSVAPQMVALRYGGYTWAPLVIESMSKPLTVPRTLDGEPLHETVQLSVASLTALDGGDWLRARQGLPTQLFNTR